jgi:hypothetical protein
MGILAEWCEHQIAYGEALFETGPMRNKVMYMEEDIGKL